MSTIPTRYGNFSFGPNHLWGAAVDWWYIPWWWYRGPKTGGLDGGCFPVFFDGCLPFFTMKAWCWTLHSWCKWNLLTQRSPRYQISQIPKMQEDDHCKPADIQRKIDICSYVHQITKCIRTLGYLDYVYAFWSHRVYLQHPTPLEN